MLHTKTHLRCLAFYFQRRRILNWHGSKFGHVTDNIPVVIVILRLFHPKDAPTETRTKLVGPTPPNIHYMAQGYMTSGSKEDL